MDGENQVQSIIQNGSVENIKQYANISFIYRGDKDQKKAYIQIVAVFVFRLHEKTDNNNIVSKIFSSDKRKFDFSKPFKVWVKDGQTDHIATLTDKKLLVRLKGLNEANNGVDYTSLSRLNLSSTVQIKIKWGTTLNTDLVN